VILTYGDDQQGYPHPDHLRVHDISLPAFELSGDDGIIKLDVIDYGTRPSTANQTLMTRTLFAGKILKDGFGNPTFVNIFTIEISRKMRLKPKQIVQVLSISERQPEVVRIFDDLVTFKVFFNLDVQSALESGLVVCDFKILSDKKIETQKLKVSSLESRFAFSVASKRKSVSISKSNNTVMVGKIDITQHVSNDKIMSISKEFPLNYCNPCAAEEEEPPPSRKKAKLEKRKAKEYNKMDTR
jgi:hypothetical protein